MARTDESYLRWKFGQSVAEGHIPNVTLVRPGEQTPAQLEPGESAIALIKLRSDIEPFLVTDARLMRGAETVVRFAEIEACDWIDKDVVMAAARKTTHYECLILEAHAGREIVIDELGQAVFPLLSFFWHKLGRRRGRAKE